MNSAAVRVLRPAIAVALVVFAASPARAQQNLGDFDGHEIAEVQFEGLERISPHALQARIETRASSKEKKEVFSANTLSKDLERLFRTGEFESSNPKEPPVDGRVELMNPANPAGPVRVIFRCRERRTVTNVIFDPGADALKHSEIDDIVKTKKGSLFDSYRVEQDKKELKAKLVEKGYLYAEVDAKKTDLETGVTVKFTIRPGPKVHVDDIVFEGATQLDPSVVKDAEGPNALETKERKLFGLLEAGTFDRRALRRDLDKIARYYRSQGYLDAKVYLDRYETSADRASLKIHVRIEEGERYSVRGVNLVGAHVIEPEKIVAELKLRPGRPFLGEDLRADIDKIKRMYADKAYIHAEVDVDVQYDVTNKLLDITYRVNEGPKVRIDRIKIEGNDKTREDVIRRELSFYPGEYFDATKVEDSLARLGRLRYFKDVRVDFEPGSEPGREDVVLKAEESRTGSFVLGGGISTNAGLFGNISLTQRNFDITNFPTSWRDLTEGHAFTGAGQTFSIQLQPGNQRSQYRVSFLEPWLLGYPILFGVDGFIFDRQREDWLEQRVGGSFSLGYRILPDLVAKATYRFERVDVADIRFNAVPDAIAVAGVNYVSAIRFALTYDKNLVDKYSVLYGGYAGTLTYEFAGLGGDAHFSRVTLEANFQTTLFEWPNDHKWVLSIYGLSGMMFPFGHNDTPIFERFFAGGPQSLRGFAFRGVGPMINDNPRGGNFITTASAEFSFPIFQHILRGVIFTDSGFVEGSSDLPTSVTWRLSAGMGFRITLPIFPAPIALDFGWPILRAHDDKRQVFSFSVGFGF
jgi:outer membrane protein insertion porin family